MKSVDVNVNHLMPIGRGKATDITGTACRYRSMITLERDGIVLNLKSMIGLLSQTIPSDGQMTLVASGVDEEEALQAVMGVLK
jgi:phosphotransferase system HPr (HPr) family protein